MFFIVGIFSGEAYGSEVASMAPMFEIHDQYNLPKAKRVAIMRHQDPDLKR